VIGEGASDCGLMLNLRPGPPAAIYCDTPGANPLTSVSVGRETRPRRSPETWSGNVIGTGKLKLQIFARRQNICLGALFRSASYWPKLYAEVAASGARERKC
jgi:hypothetical protein